MNRPSRRLLASVLVLALDAAPTVAVAGSDHARCVAAARQAPGDRRLLDAVAEAREQHRLFGGQTIDGSGGLVRVGFHEAEFDRPRGESTPTWKRVAGFWSALDEALPAGFRSPTGLPADRKQLFEQIAAQRAADGSPRLDEQQLSAIESAFLRAALVDHPWSAVFISFLMKRSGFRPEEFAFSDSHVDYVDQAFQASAAEAAAGLADAAYRACDAAATKPRAGDLLCYTRESASTFDTYDKLRRQLALRRTSAAPGSFPMHCDLVTRSDENRNAKLEAIGGNVFQSVTLRRMSLNDGRTLGRKYFRTEHPARANLSRNRWVVLLQSRN